MNVLQDLWPYAFRACSRRMSVGALLVLVIVMRTWVRSQFITQYPETTHCCWLSLCALTITYHIENKLVKTVDALTLLMFTV